MITFVVAVTAARLHRQLAQSGTADCTGVLPAGAPQSVDDFASPVSSATNTTL